MSKSTDNYPDDIRCYDNVPGSPFYVDPLDAIEDARDALVSQWQAEYARTGKVAWFGGGDPHDELAEGETLGAMFDRIAQAQVESEHEKYLDDLNRR
jgi:hypothetical protein